MKELEADVSLLHACFMGIRGCLLKSSHQEAVVFHIFT